MSQDAVSVTIVVLLYCAVATVVIVAVDDVSRLLARWREAKALEVAERAEEAAEAAAWDDLGRYALPRPVEHYVLGTRVRLTDHCCMFGALNVGETAEVVAYDRAGGNYVVRVLSTGERGIVCGNALEVLQ